MHLQLQKETQVPGRDLTGGCSFQKCYPGYRKSLGWDRKSGQNEVWMGVCLGCRVPVGLL